MIGFGFAPDWETLAGLRVVFGALEAGFFPVTAIRTHSCSDY